MNGYEFTELQNQRIDQITQKLSHISIIFFAFGIVQLLGAFLVSTGAVVWGAAASGALFLGLGYVYQRPLDNLKNITTTKSRDIDELMIGLDDLHIAFLTGQVLIAFLSVVLVADIIRLLI
jgi:hypothetical protein